MIAYYILFLGIAVILVGLSEMLAPHKAFALWKKWSESSFFRLHGIFLIASGFPLTIYKGPLSILVFIIGIIIVLTGPFVLLYPEKFRGLFASIQKEIDVEGVGKMVYFDGGVRIVVGVLLIISFLLR